MANSIRFKDWLRCELEKRNWSYRELARHAGKNASNPLISQVMTGKRSITWDFCAAVAIALDHSPVEVFRIAELLPAEGEKEK